MLKKSDCRVAGLEARIGALGKVDLGIVILVVLEEAQRTVCTRIDMSILSSHEAQCTLILRLPSKAVK